MFELYRQTYGQNKYQFQDIEFAYLSSCWHELLWYKTVYNIPPKQWT